MTLGDFLPYILPRAKGCPEIVANQATRMAIIELCRKAMIWREYQQPVISVALQTSYAYAPAADQQVLELLTLTMSGGDVPVVTPIEGKNRDLHGNITPYAYGGFAGFELRPAQAAGLPVITYSVVAPSISTNTVPDAMSRYIEEIANGALSRLLVAKDKEYSDMPNAANCMQLWAAAVNSAKSDAFDGFARTTQRTASVRF